MAEYNHSCTSSMGFNTTEDKVKDLDNLIKILEHINLVLQTQDELSISDLLSLVKQSQDSLSLEQTITKLMAYLTIGSNELSISDLLSLVKQSQDSLSMSDLLHLVLQVQDAMTLSHSNNINMVLSRSVTTGIGVQSIAHLVNQSIDQMAFDQLISVLRTYRKDNTQVFNLQDLVTFLRDTFGINFIISFEQIVEYVMSKLVINKTGLSQIIATLVVVKKTCEGQLVLSQYIRTWRVDPLKRDGGSNYSGALA